MTTVRYQLGENEDFGDEKTRRTPNGLEARSRESTAADATASSNSDLSAHAGEHGQDHDLQEKTEDVPPNGGYGWVCVACIATINA
jgi:hypothetical protein